MGVNPVRVAVLASGRGTNLQALLDARDAGELSGRVVLVVSDRPDAPALDRARAAGVPALHLPWPRGGREAFEQNLLDLLQRERVDLVVLAGFMRLLGQRVVGAFRHRIINVHPSLLPAFPGLDAPRQALDYGVRVSGCTVHFVDEGVDSGPIILQAAVPVLPGDDAGSLHGRIQAVEHRLLPQAVDLFARGCLRVMGRRVEIEDPEDGGR